jgi:hypothetical protein
MQSIGKLFIVTIDENKRNNYSRFRGVTNRKGGKNNEGKYE